MKTNLLLDISKSKSLKSIEETLIEYNFNTDISYDNDKRDKFMTI